MYVSGNLSNCYFKRKIFGKMMVLRNRCINPCPEKCILSQIPIPSHNIYSEQLECFPASFRTRSLGCWNPNHSQMSLIWGNNCFNNSPIQVFWTAKYFLPLEEQTLRRRLHAINFCWLFKVSIQVLTTFIKYFCQYPSFFLRIFFFLST